MGELERMGTKTPTVTSLKNVSQTGWQSAGSPLGSSGSGVPTIWAVNISIISSNIPLLHVSKGISPPVLLANTNTIARKLNILFWC